MISMVWPASEGLAWAHEPTVIGGPNCGLCHCQKPCRSPCSIFPLTVKSKEAVFAVMLIVNVLLTKRDMDSFCDSPYPTPTPTPPKKSSNLNRKTLKRALKSVIRVVKCSSTQLVASGGCGVWEGRTQLSLRADH